MPSTPASPLTRLTFLAALAVFLTACAPVPTATPLADDIDFDPVTTDYNGDMFEITTTPIGNQSVQLLGILPDKLESHDYIDHDIHYAYYSFGSRRQTFLLLVQTGRDVKIAELISRRSFIYGAGLPSFSDIYDALHDPNPTLKLTPCLPGQIYVDARFYKELRDHPLRLPHRYTSLLEQTLNDATTTPAP